MSKSLLNGAKEKEMDEEIKLKKKDFNSKLLRILLSNVFT